MPDTSAVPTHSLPSCLLGSHRDGTCPSLAAEGNGVAPDKGVPKLWNEDKATHRPGNIDLQTSTNFSGSSGEKAMPFSRPCFFVTKT